MDMHPFKAEGIFGWVLTGFIGGLVALFVGYLVPSLIPTRVTTTKI